MQRILAGILLSSLLLAQAAKAPLMLQWQRLANESFTELFCVNKVTEPVPMCFGSCQIDDLADEMMEGNEDDGSLSSASASPSGVLYCLLPANLPAPRLIVPEVAAIIKPLTIPRLSARDYVGTVFEPPVLA